MAHAGAKYIGNVHGGQQPISGAAIQIYVLGNGLDGTAGVPLLSTPVYTDAGGGFTIDPSTYTCPNYGSLTYVTATGGNPGIPGLVSNPKIAEMAMTDACTPLADRFISINEVTTVASVFFYGQYFGLYPNVGYASTNSAAMYTYLLDYQAILNPITGLPPGSRPIAGAQFPVSTMFSLANVISSCINSDGGTAGDTSPCTKLLTLATPAGGTAPTNTVDALVNLYRNPLLNVSNIFGLQTPSAPYEPSLSSAPANWYLRYTTNTPATPLYKLCTTWGDSLTQGSEDGSGITIAIELANLPSCYAGNNQGVGGQDSVSIGIREGGVASTATVAGAVIPAFGPVNLAFDAAAQPVDPNGPGRLPITINGVDGLVSFDYSTYDEVFTRNTPGVSVASPAQSAVTVNVGAQNSGFVVIWAGRNNSGQQAIILSDIAAMVAALPSPKHFVVLSLTNRDSDSEFAGGAGYAQIIGVNQALAAAYPNNYLDIRSAVVAGYDPSNVEDVLDHSHDVPPSTLRALDEFGNLATAMNATTCTFSVMNGGIEGDYTMILEQEKIRIVTSDGTNVTACIRGYAGTQAVAHAPGVAYSGIDYIHLNAAADILIAKLVDQYIQTH